MIRGLRNEHQAVIEGLQPYKRGRGGKNNLLWRLGEINNADKHRLIQVVGARIAGVTYGGPIAERPTFTRQMVRILKDGAKIAESSRYVQVKPGFVPFIAFSEGCIAVERRPVYTTLRRIAEHVSEIVEGFGPEFE
jgi:hypothetical protein